MCTSLAHNVASPTLTHLTKRRHLDEDLLASINSQLPIRVDEVMEGCFDETGNGWILKTGLKSGQGHFKGRARTCFGILIATASSASSLEMICDSRYFFIA